jgi:hypothetical protein
MARHLMPSLIVPDRRFPKKVAPCDRQTVAAQGQVIKCADVHRGILKDSQRPSDLMSRPQHDSTCPFEHIPKMERDNGIILDKKNPQMFERPSH